MQQTPSKPRDRDDTATKEGSTPTDDPSNICAEHHQKSHQEHTQRTNANNYSHTVVTYAEGKGLVWEDMCPFMMPEM